MSEKAALVRMTNPNAKRGEPSVGDFHPDERKTLEAAGWRAVPAQATDPGDILASKTDEELLLIAKEYHVKVPGGDRRALVQAILKAAGYKAADEAGPTLSVAPHGGETTTQESARE